MFENPRRGRQARKFWKKCSENSGSQIVFRTHIFRKLSLGAPGEKSDTARLALLADIYPIWPHFLPFSPTAEPGPRLEQN